jgi:hypothetical protein
MIKIIIATINTTINIPAYIPVLNIPPIISQLLNKVIQNAKRGKVSFFITKIKKAKETIFFRFFVNQILCLYFAALKRSETAFQSTTFQNAAI